MKTSVISVCLAAATVAATLGGADAFVPASLLTSSSSAGAFVRASAAMAPTGTTSPSRMRTAPLHAKYNTMDEILALFPDDKPVLVNFYDAATENDIKNDIFRAKTLLKDRCTLCSIKQQDYPELAKLWDANSKSPSMILFSDGKPVCRLYEETHYLEIVAKVGQYCRPAGEEHKPYTK